MKGSFNIEVRSQQRKYRVNQRLIKKKAGTILSLCGLENVELSILIVNNRRIKVLNKIYRGVDKPTDVLAFPMDENNLLGDIVISMEKTHSQAREQGHPPARELMMLLTHGILHLIGYDHEISPREEKRMRKRENFILSRI